MQDFSIRGAKIGMQGPKGLSSERSLKNYYIKMGFNAIIGGHKNKFKSEIFRGLKIYMLVYETHVL